MHTFPTAVEPVNDILAILLSSIIYLPILIVDSLLAGNTLNTPLGMPASTASYIMVMTMHTQWLILTELTSAKASALNGVSSDGFNTTVHPAASAAPALRVAMAMGKFH